MLNYLIVRRKIKMGFKILDVSDETKKQKIQSERLAWKMKTLTNVDERR